MHNFRRLYGICLLLLPMSALAQAANQTAPETASEQTLTPSMELLEFLADFGDLNEQTYDLIEYHALQDQKKINEEPSNDQ